MSRLLLRNPVSLTHFLLAEIWKPLLSSNQVSLQNEKKWRPLLWGMFPCMVCWSVDTQMHVFGWSDVRVLWHSKCSVWEFGWCILSGCRGMWRRQMLLLIGSNLKASLGPKVSLLSDPHKLLHNCFLFLELFIKLLNHSCTDVKQHSSLCDIMQFYIY